jgi:hypothetical protein
MRTCIVPPPRTTGTYAGTSYERATGVHEHTLPVERQAALEMDCAGGDLQAVLLTTVTRTAGSLRHSPFCRLPARHRASGPFSYLDLRIQPNIDGTLVVHIFDAAHDLNIDKPETLLDPAMASRNGSTLIAMLSGRLQILVDGRPASASWSGPEVLAERQSLQLQVRFAVDHAPGTVTVTAALFPYDPTHQTFINIYENRSLTQAILDHNKPSFEYFSGTRQGVLAVVDSFCLRQDHILIGPDHLLFLVGLLLLGGGIRKLAIVVTAFTVAAQHHAVPRGPQHRQPAVAPHRARHCLEYCLCRHRQPACARRPRRSKVDRVRLRLHSRLRLC